MGQIVAYLLMAQKFTNLKQKILRLLQLYYDSEIVATLLCLGNISKDWSTDNMRKSSLLVMFMILLLVMMLFVLIILKIFISI